MCQNCSNQIENLARKCWKSAILRFCIRAKKMYPAVYILTLHKYSFLKDFYILSSILVIFCIGQYICNMHNIKIICLRVHNSLNSLNNWTHGKRALCCIFWKHWIDQCDHHWIQFGIYFMHLSTGTPLIKYFTAGIYRNGGFI